MSINIQNSSRLVFADFLSAEGVEFWDTLVLPVSRPRKNDMTYIVKSGDKIDQLAQKFYQDPVLWWVIAWANDLEILPTDMKEGMELSIPSRDFVQSEMINRAGRSF